MIMELMPPQPTADQSMQYLMASIFYTVIMYHLVPSFWNLHFLPDHLHIRQRDSYTRYFRVLPDCYMLLRAIPVSSDAYSFASIAVNLSAPCLLLHCPSGTVILRMVRMQPGRLVHLQCGHSLVPVSYTHLRAHETRHDLVCRLLLEKKQKSHYLA